MKRYVGGLAAAILGGAALPAVPQKLASSVTRSSSIRAPASLSRRARAASPAALFGPPPSSRREVFDPDPRGRHLDGLWKHRMAVSRRPRGMAPIEAASQDTGEIAVLQDAGDLMTRANPLDLADAAVRFRSNSSGGYDAEQAPYGFRQPFGDALTLTDDDSREMALPFGFTFFNQQYDRVFVNSDGNLTFTEADTASTARSVSRFLTGPPRLAPLFADLDPSTGGQGARIRRCRDRFSVTWCGVREFDRPETATMQITLLADGRIEVHVSGQTTIRQAVVGASPGRTADFVIADFSNPGGNAGGAGAIGESFTDDVRPRHDRREPAFPGHASGRIRSADCLHRRAAADQRVRLRGDRVERHHGPRHGRRSATRATTAAPGASSRCATWMRSRNIRTILAGSFTARTARSASSVTRSVIDGSRS